MQHDRKLGSADLLFEGHPFAVLEAQSIKADFGTWRWYLYDRERNEARLLALHAPAGSYSLGNPTVRALTGRAQKLARTAAVSLTCADEPCVAARRHARRAVVASERGPRARKGGALVARSLRRGKEGPARVAKRT